MRLLLVVLVVGCAASQPVCPVFRPTMAHRPFVWEVSGNGARMIVQGTHQGAGLDVISPPSWAGFERATVYITEADEVPVETAPWQQALLLPPHRSLENLLVPRDFDALVSHLGSDREHVGRMKPWTAFVALANAAHTYPRENLNAALLARARARHMTTYFLDTWKDQTRYLDRAITKTELAQAIHDFPKLRCSLPQRLDAFHVGVDRVFENEIGPDDDHVLERIERWSTLILRHLARSERPIYLAVGIGQLVGPSGLLLRFSAAGYEVRRL